MTTNSSENPWLGPASYDEDDQNNFFGREVEINELVSRIKGNNLTILFGRSGLGKTSLLCAGVIPELRKSSFFPVYLRINYRDAHNLGDQLQDKVFWTINETLKAAKEPELVVSNKTDIDELNLWEFFHDDKLWNKRNDLLQPVLIFDQFEEVFTLGSGQQAVRFKEQLADLAENRIPMALRERVQENNESLSFTNRELTPKIVLSLREDHVSRLDSLRSLIPSIIHNRFDLKPLSSGGAADVVYKPAEKGKWVTRDVAEYIVKHEGVLYKSSERTDTSDLSSEEKEINPTYLSIMCHELFIRMCKDEVPEISRELVDREKGNILESLYNRSFDGLSPKTREYIEENLVKEGIRILTPRDAMAKEVSEKDIDELINRKLIQTEIRSRKPHVELIHDQFIDVVTKSRDARRHDAAESKKRQLLIQKAVTILSILLLIGLIVDYYGWIYSYKAYYKNFTKRNGKISLLGKLSKAAAKHRSWSLRVTKKGWLGEVQEIDALDSLGNLVPYHTLDTYLKFSDVHASIDERECQWEFNYDKNNKLVTEINLDKQGNIKNQFRYDQHMYGYENKSKLLFIGLSGYQQQQMTNSTGFIEIIRDTNGFESELRFIDIKGNPAPGPDGIFIRQFEYDEKGRKVKDTSLDAAGQPIVDSTENAIKLFYYDGNDNITKVKFLDKDNKLTKVTKQEFDSWGNVRERSFDIYRKPVNNNEGIYKETYDYDSNGKVKLIKFFYSKDDSVAENYVGISSLSFVYDSQGRITEETRLDKNSHDKNSKADYDRTLGVATVKFKFNDKSKDKNDDKDKPIEQSFFDVKGKMMMGPGGFAKVVTELKNGREETIYFGPERILNRLNGWVISAKDTSKTGQTIDTYMNSIRKLIAGPQGWAKHRQVFDEKTHQVIIDEYFDEKEQPAYGPYGYYMMKLEDNNKSYYFDNANREISASDMNDMVHLLYVDHIDAVYSPAVTIGIQVGDILWRFGAWTFTGALNTAMSKHLPANVATKQIPQDFENAQKSAFAKTSELVVIRNGKQVKLQVPKLNENERTPGINVGSPLGIQIKDRALPRTYYTDWAKNFQQ